MNLKTLFIALAIVVLIAVPASAQLNTLTGTTLSVAATANASTVTVASATGLVAPTATLEGSLLFVVSPGSKGEVMQVSGPIVGTVVPVSRGREGSAQVAQVSGALVLHGRPDLFYTTNPTGGCVAATVNVTPWVNVRDGLQWLCSTITLSWVPGFGNTTRPAQPTAAVASAAGVIVPSGPLFHVTGALAITGFTVPLGYNGTFCIIPDGAYTTTTAGNIAATSTAIVGKPQCYQYDRAAAKPFFPSY